MSYLCQAGFLTIVIKARISQKSLCLGNEVGDVQSDSKIGEVMQCPTGRHALGEIKMLLFLL